MAMIMIRTAVVVLVVVEGCSVRVGLLMYCLRLPVVYPPLQGCSNPDPDTSLSKLPTDN